MGSRYEVARVTSSPLLEAALAYARAGWPVFPCSPENKQPLTPKESQPGARDGGLYVATCDEAQITRWWQRLPRAMIGLPTGRASGTLVIDLDPREHSAEAMLAALETWLGEPVTCAISRTQSGGLHLVYAMPDEALGNRAGLFRKIPGAPAEIRTHVDVRADGGYIIVPPSVMASGTYYEWQVSVPVHPCAAAPQKLIDAIAKRLDDSSALNVDNTRVSGERAVPTGDVDSRIAENRRKYAYAALARQTQSVATCLQGSRNQALNNAALALGHIVGAGLLSEATVFSELFAAATACGLVKDDGPESARKTIESGLRAGIAQPLDVSNIGTRVAPPHRDRAASAARPLSSAAPEPEPPPPPDSEADFGSPAPSGDAGQSGASHGGASASADDQGGVGAEENRARRKARWRLRLNARCAGLPLTDLGNAQRFVQRYGRNFFYVEQWGWLAWDGKRWNARDADAILNRAVHATVKAIAGEARVLRMLAQACDDEDGDIRDTQRFDPLIEIHKTKGKVFKSDKITGWAMASQSNAHITCIARLAQAYLTAAPESFDADLCALNVANGTLRFAKTGDDTSYVRFDRHRREDMLTKLTPVTYDPAATAPVYDAFLARVQPDIAMRRHLHAWGGVSLTGLPLARMAFWYGKGRNGKSTLIDCWAHVMGEYSQTIPIESFLDQGRAKRGGEASPDIAALPGVRCLRTSEPERGAQLAEGLIKLITGGEPMRARHLNRDFFEFRPAFKLTMQGNYRPGVSGTDEGFWRRMLLVPWGVTIPETEVDTALPDKLRAEASGILNRLVDGLCDYFDHGLSPTEEIEVATADYRQSSDPVGRFLAECTVALPVTTDPVTEIAMGDPPSPRGVDVLWHEARTGADGRKLFQARVTGKDVYALYVAWARADGEKVWGNKGFSKGLLDHGIRRLKSSGVYYLDLGLVARPEQFEGLEIEGGDEFRRK